MDSALIQGNVGTTVTTYLNCAFLLAYPAASATPPKAPSHGRDLWADYRRHGNSFEEARAELERNWSLWCEAAGHMQD